MNRSCQHLGICLITLFFNWSIILAQSGNVGIGTEDPKSLLHVYGNGLFRANGSGLLIAPNVNYTQIGYSEASSGYSNLTLSWAKSYFNGNLGIGESNPSVPLHVRGITYLNGRLLVDTTTLVVDDILDYIGIGIDNPTSKLHVYGNGLFRKDGGGLYISPQSNYVQLGYAHSSGSFGNLTFKQGISYFNGNLGIGINNPQVPLQVEGVSRLNGRTEIDTNTLIVDDVLNRVGISTDMPKAKIHVEGDLLATGELTGQPGDPPLIGPGTRMMWYPDKAAFRVGVVENGYLSWDKDSIGNNSFAFGKTTLAKGTSSMAGGFRSEASENFSFAMGSFSKASGPHSLAFGYSSTATQDYAHAFGWYSKAYGDFSLAVGSSQALGNYSTALGNSIASSSFSSALGAAQANASYAFATGQSIAESSYSCTIGRYNVGGGSVSGWTLTDKIFEIGIGSNSSNKANAMTVLKNGNVGIGTSNPDLNLQITGGTDANLGGGGFFQTGFTNAQNILIDDNEIMSRNNGTASTLYINNDGGNIILNGFSAGKIGIGTSSPAEKLEVVGGIKVDGNTFNVDETNNRVGIGTSSPNKNLHVLGSARFETNSIGNEIVIDASTGLTEVEFQNDGVFGASIGYSIDDDRIYLYHGGNVFVKSGRIGIGIDPTHKIHISGGAYCDGGTWVNGSSKDIKGGFEKIDKSEILKKLCTLEISEWSYKDSNPTVRHIGPMSQDFFNQFRLGQDDQSISTVDISGVTIAAVQAQQDQIEKLKVENETLKKQLNDLLTRIELIEKAKENN